MDILFILLTVVLVLGLFGLVVLVSKLERK